MVLGALGKIGALAPSHVVEEFIAENAIVTIQPQKMEERTVTLMDLVMKCLKPAMIAHALVSEILKTCTPLS